MCADSSIENIQGRKAVEGGEMCLRKTTNGVDLNRNWGYAWVQVGARMRNRLPSDLIVRRFKSN